jgi:bifunctional UDP-N-acetylglucosamine pyrophosphorylase/glucosamine-1-phosphate N-acetyltransferase
VVGEATEIGPGTRLVDCVVGDRTQVEATVGVDADIGDDAVVGPFASLGPGAAVPSGTRTGPYYAAP